MKTLKISLLAICALLVFSTISVAMDATLKWDDNPDADYYIISYGTSPGDYTNTTAKINKPTTEYIFSGLPETTHYFAVKAYNTCGNSSDFSDEVSNGPLPGKVTSVIVQTCVTYEAQ